MTTRKKFNLLTTPIGDDTMLIEASAGTGKTFTIAFLVLRLLLERKLPIEKILVTTFTELATAELRGRIRERLRDALAHAEGGPAKDPQLKALIASHSKEEAAGRLRDALLNFDQAPIHTIHGFCARLLKDRAIESRALFDPEMLTDQRDLLLEIVQDFRRRQFYQGDRFAAALALDRRVSVDALFEDIQELTRNPGLVVLPATTRAAGEIAANLEEVLPRLRGAWQKEAEAIRRKFAKPTWAIKEYKDPAYAAQYLDRFDLGLENAAATLQHLDCVRCLSRSAVTKGTAAAATPPSFETFDACEEICVLAQELCTKLRVEFFDYAREQLRERKLDRNLLGYEDLLIRVDEALAGEGGAELVALVRERYQAALIDEFQDTDPVQYSIFRRLFSGSGQPLAFIGDPKQAIYSFRGADVFTYMNAAREAARDFTLTTNWRSESRLVRAVNTIFTRRTDPFVFEEIPFIEVEANPQADARLLLVDGQQEPPFQLWTHRQKKDLPEVVASEIVRLLHGNVTIGDAPLEPPHIAVLTSTNDQASEMQHALRKRGVPSVLYSGANIYTTREAHELIEILAAVIQPGHERLVRAALCTDALGLSGNDIDELSRDESAFEAHLLHFQEFHQTWRALGFIQMLNQLARTYKVRPRLLRYADGERRLTNFLHLIELLHTACVERRLGMNGLHKWLAHQMGGESYADREAHELRLESDARAVRLITVHKSKGLEYPVVFCPFVGHVHKQLRASFHDEKNAWRLTVDLSDAKAFAAEREKEALAERVRQFYVALTRARHRCTMIWRATNRPDKSAPTRFLGNESDAAIASGDDICVSDLPAATAGRYIANAVALPALAPRIFHGSIDRSWGQASFTKLISGRELDDASDEVVAVEPAREPIEPAPMRGMHAFPRGLAAGTALHGIIEHAVFDNLADAEGLVSRKLRAHNIPGQEEIVLRHLHDLAATPLEGFTLAETTENSRVPELEFWFPITSLTTKKLAEAFGHEVRLQLDRLRFSPVNGLMNGKIDLVVEHRDRFYFLDWKSNWLGPDVDAYGPEALRAAMEHHFYPLQLSLYSVALHRYLRQRKPDYDYEQHFGGAFYVFLRGIDPARPGHGIYHERLTRKRVEELSALFES